MSTWLPQLIMVGIVALGAGISLSRYGEPKKLDRHDLIDIIVGPAITLGLLAWGGFFSGLGS